MTIEFNDDRTVSPAGGGAAGPRPIPFAAFLPIAVALIGIAAILFGGVQARDPATAITSLMQPDSMVTGSVAPQPGGRNR